MEDHNQEPCHTHTKSTNYLEDIIETTPFATVTKSKNYLRRSLTKVYKILMDATIQYRLLISINLLIDSGKKKKSQINQAVYHIHFWGTDCCKGVKSA